MMNELITRARSQGLQPKTESLGWTSSRRKEELVDMLVDVMNCPWHAPFMESFVLSGHHLRRPGKVVEEALISDWTKPRMHGLLMLVCTTESEMPTCAVNHVTCTAWPRSAAQLGGGHKQH